MQNAECQKITNGLSFSFYMSFFATNSILSILPRKGFKPILKSESNFPSFFLDTSRASRPGEIHGKDYFFDTREQMEIDIAAGKFIEHGEYR